MKIRRQIYSTVLCALLTTGGTASAEVISLFDIGNRSEILGEFVGGNSGVSLVSGDFNGDGIDDIAFGSPYASTSLMTWNGAVSILFGSEDFTKGQLDLDEVHADVNFFGARSEDLLGSDLEVVDFNEDGIDDLVSYAPGSGEVYVEYGRENWTDRSMTYENEYPSKMLAPAHVSGPSRQILSTVDMTVDNTPKLALKSGKSLLVYMDGHRTVTPRAIRTGDNRYVMYVQSADLLSTSSGQELLVIELLDNEKVANDSVKYTVYSVDKLSGHDVDMIVDQEQALWTGIDNLGVDIDIDRASIIPTIDEAGSDGVVNDLTFVINGGLANSGAILYTLNFGAKTSQISRLDSPAQTAILGENTADIVLGSPGRAINANKQVVNQVGRLDFLDVLGSKVLSSIQSHNVGDLFGYSIVQADPNSDLELDIIVAAPYGDGSRADKNGRIYILWGNQYRADSEPLNEDKNEQPFLTRGEFLGLVNKQLDLKGRNSDFIDNCKQYINFCLFNFTTMSSFSGIDLEDDILLYPDVPNNHPYYEEINLATMLGIINGYLEEDETPFKPDQPITRIQALKIALNGAELVEHLYRFELSEKLGSYENILKQTSYFEDVRPSLYHMWWYPRYSNFAWEQSLIEKNPKLRPDEKITAEEAKNLLKKTLEIINEADEKDQS